MDLHDTIAIAIADSTGALTTPIRLAADPKYHLYLMIECDDYCDEPDGSRWYWGTTADGEPWSVIVEGAE